ncbi:hypothetical protein [Paenisporosarcina sp. NPDC076898]|uniref:hypothetical protein n=1 Tax=unclassified Paenisporosarcina TaxID=2642018 RepID=UPI003CFE4ECF
MENVLDKLIEEGIELENSEGEKTGGSFEAYRARIRASTMDIEKFNVWIVKAIDYLKENDKGKDSESVKNILRQYSILTSSHNREFYEIVMGKLKSLKE